MSTHQSDFLVVGSGLAGLAFALKAAEYASVTIVTKDVAPNANTSWAQGGIAAVMSKDDSFENHIYDTMQAGAGLCLESVVRNYVEQAPDRVRELIEWGVQFDIHDEDGKLDLTREGGHRQRRILHFEDSTGAEIHRKLLEKCRNHPRIQLFEGYFAIDLIQQQRQCVGSYVLNKKTGEVHVFTAKTTILATGGAGKVYLYTSNWSGATGDGIAMAHRAGARVANLEFMQFHPTCLYHPESRNFLITEAMRGEGGELIDHQREPFMLKYHEMGSLAPRDIVARSIDAEMKKTGAPCVYLDMTKKSREYLSSRFPSIYQRCQEYGIDIATQPIPVVPAAHYLCGGVLTDMNGKTDIPNLWCLGETACTGLHGANRLASNSLLECLAMAHNCSTELKTVFASLQLTKQAPTPWIHPQQTDADEMIVIHHMWDEIRRLMWNYVGIVRSNKRLERAAHRLTNILTEVKDYYSNMRIHSDIIELRNIAIVADLSVRCALKRKESRGIHFSLDYPPTLSPGPAKDTIA